MKNISIILTAILLISCGASTSQKKDTNTRYHGLQSKVFGHPSVTELLTALKIDPTNKVGQASANFGTWTIVQNSNTGIIWSFTPEAHPAHPSVVKRSVVERDGSIHIQMQVSCNSEKYACDNLVQSFKELNEQMGKTIRADST